MPMSNPFFQLYQTSVVHTFFYPHGLAFSLLSITVLCGNELHRWILHFFNKTFLYIVFKYLPLQFHSFPPFKRANKSAYCHLSMPITICSLVCFCHLFCDVHSGFSMQVFVSLWHYNIIRCHPTFMYTFLYYLFCIPLWHWQEFFELPTMMLEPSSWVEIYLELDNMYN